MAENTKCCQTWMQLPYRKGQQSFVEITLHCLKQPLPCCQGKGLCKLLEVTSVVRSSNCLNESVHQLIIEKHSYSKSTHGETKSSKHPTLPPQPWTPPSASKSSPHGAATLSKPLVTPSTSSSSKARSHSRRGTRRKAKSGM